MSRRRLSKREAAELAKSHGIDLKADFYELSSSQVETLAGIAKLMGYRKRRDAPGSTARMFFQYLQRGAR